MLSLGKIFNRALTSMSMRFHVATANAWRDGYNPLRGLTIQRSVSYLEEGERGAYAGLQWLYRYVEMQDATLGALIERRTSAVQGMGWDVKIPEELEGSDKKLAEDQAKVLKDAYNHIGNLKQAIEFLCMASFRGYSHLEVIKEGGKIVELSPVEQWFWVRNGLDGVWQYNKDSKIGTNKGVDTDDALFVVREVARPINRVALVCFVRKNMSQKDWDGFIETYGIPAVFIIAPSDVPKEKEGEYQDVADQIASDARGVLPGGSDVKTVDNGARGVNPFLEHIQYQDEQVVLRGTGGKLTMLAESGSGTLAGSAHQETFDQVARAEALEISEILREVIDSAVLEARFPGKPQFAYFEISANEETDTSAVVDDVTSLSAAGYQVAPDQVRERTGYDVELAQPAQQTEETRFEDRRQLALTNREKGTVSEDVEFEEAARQLLDQARAEDLQELGNALESILQIEDQEELQEELLALSDKLPEMDAGTSSAKAWESILTGALVNGLAEAEDDKLHNVAGGAHWRDQGRGGNGKFGAGSGGKGTSREPKTNPNRDRFGKLPGKGKFLSPRDNERRAKRVVSHVMKGGSGRSVERAMIRPGLGEVRFDYGSNDKNNKGFGLSHIKGKHGKEQLQKLPKVLARGEIYKHHQDTEGKRYVVLGKDVAILQRKGKGAAKSWSITSFDEEREAQMAIIKEKSRRVKDRYIPDQSTQ